MCNKAVNTYPSTIWFTLEYYIKTQEMCDMLVNSCVFVFHSVPDLKLVSAIFYQIFIFHQMIALQKL